MVTATANPNVVRVSFIETNMPAQRSEVVCEVEATDTGELEITYLYHLYQSRLTGNGDWDDEHRVCNYTIASPIEQMIRSQVSYQLAHTFLKSGIRLAHTTGVRDREL